MPSKGDGLKDIANGIEAINSILKGVLKMAYLVEKHKKGRAGE